MPYRCGERDSGGGPYDEASSLHQRCVSLPYTSNERCGNRQAQRHFENIFSELMTASTGRQLGHFGRALEEWPEYQRPEGAKREVLMIEGIGRKACDAERTREGRSTNVCLATVPRKLITWATGPSSFPNRRTIASPIRVL